MTTTKLVINERVSLPKERRRNLRAAVHKLEQRAAFDHYDDGLLKEINSVAVKVGQLKGYHVAEGTQLKERLRDTRNRVAASLQAGNQKRLPIAASAPDVHPASTSPPWDE